MNIEKLPSGSYRIKQMENGIVYRVTVDHKPTNAEAIRLLSDRIRKPNTRDMTFRDACNAYIDSKANILSPATKREYLGTVRRLPDVLLNKHTTQITTMDVQKVVNDYAKDHSPKTVANYSGFIMAVLKSVDIDIKAPQLPQKVKKTPYIPSVQDIEALFAVVKGTKYEIPYVLAALGMRRSEICALTIEDVHDNYITINKALVKDANKKWVIKQPKTPESTRVIPIKPEMADKIHKQGYVYNGMPGTLYKMLQKFQDKAGIPHFPLHKMRHFFASYMHLQGYPDKQIMSVTGHKTDKCLKDIYQHAMDMDKAKTQMSAEIFSLLE